MTPAMRPLTSAEVTAYEAAGMVACDRTGCEFPPAFMSVDHSGVHVRRDLLCGHHAAGWTLSDADLGFAGFERCQHCKKLISVFGGVWFERQHSSVCYASPDTQHRPYGVEVPPPAVPPVFVPATDARRAVRDALHRMLRLAYPTASTLADHVAALPATVIERCADTTSTHCAAHRKGWN